MDYNDVPDAVQDLVAGGIIALGYVRLDVVRLVLLFLRPAFGLPDFAALLLGGDDATLPLELFTLGGSESLRGYREDQFRGTVVALASLEYRLLLGRVSRIFPFVDLGYYYRPCTTAAEDDGYRVRTESDIVVGYGFGLRVDSRAGVLGLDYGLGRGDGVRDGKVHLRMENLF